MDGSTPKLVEPGVGYVDLATLETVGPLAVKDACAEVRLYFAKGEPLWQCDAAAFAVDATRTALKAYFAGKAPALPPLDLRGTEFQLAVWRALLEIPWGETRSYGDVAARIGRAGSARAVGGANHENPIAILVPCHRVVASGGALGGYGGGIEKKRWLLAHEASHGPVLRMG